MLGYVNKLGNDDIRYVNKQDNHDISDIMSIPIK